MLWNNKKLIYHLNVTKFWHVIIITHFAQRPWLVLFLSKIWLSILFLSFRCSSLDLSKVLKALNQRMLEPITEVQLVSNVMYRTIRLMHDYVRSSCFAINPHFQLTVPQAAEFDSHWKYTKVLAVWRITIVHKQGLVVTFWDCYIACIRPIEKRL